MQSSTKVQGLFIYPIKALAGIPVQSLHFNSSGVVDDRKFMIVNHQGRFISQRSHPVLATFQVDAHPEGWWVSIAHHTGVLIPSQTEWYRPMAVSVWKDQVQAWEVSSEVSGWFSEQLDEYVHLVVIDDLAGRVKSHQGVSGQLAFADGYPLLVANRSSLNHLNNQIGERLSMRRFRPNIVVDIEPFREYQVEKLRLGDQQSLVLSEPCVRCNVPSIEPFAGVFQPEINRLLKSSLIHEGQVVFGMNAFAQGISELRLNDELWVV